MYVYAIKIEALERGISIEGVSIDKSLATPLERKIAGCLDIGFRLVQEAIMQEVKKGVVVEGKNIEAYVNAGIKKVGGFNMREALKEAGYKVE